MLEFKEEDMKTENFEANDYFKDLKNRVDKVTKEKLEHSEAIIANEIQKAKRIGQKNLAHKSAYMWQTVAKEFILHSLGYEDYVNADDVTRFIDKVRPKRSVKIVELERYPRVIPDKNVEDIEKAKELDIFDMMVVLYTDFTNESVSTPAEKEMVARNTDPIVFGVFRNDKLNLTHSRMYLITDWEDEFCDLTFSKMIDEMSTVGIEDGGKKITVDVDHINKMAAEALTEVEEATQNSIQVGTNQVAYKKGFFSNSFAKLKGFFSK